jgi:hypothetical protein
MKPVVIIAPPKFKTRFPNSFHSFINEALNIKTFELNLSLFTFQQLQLDYNES